MGGKHRCGMVILGCQSAQGSFPLLGPRAHQAGCPGLQFQVPVVSNTQVPSPLRPMGLLCRAWSPPGLSKYFSPPVLFCPRRPICLAFLSAALMTGTSVHLSLAGAHGRGVGKLGEGVTLSKLARLKPRSAGFPGAHLAAGILLSEDERAVELPLHGCVDRDFHQLVLELYNQSEALSEAGPSPWETPSTHLLPFSPPASPRCSTYCL